MPPLGGLSFAIAPIVRNSSSSRRGVFVLGDDAGESSEKPARRVSVPRAFAIGRFEVTFDQWRACVEAQGCDRIPDDHGWGRGRRPVINVTYAEIQSYVSWLSAHAGKPYRLPSEAEWEYASRAGTTSAYWWGDDVGNARANCRDCGSAWSGKRSAPVGSFEPNPWGLFDTAGNVWEWVADCWNPDHAAAPATSVARTTGDCGHRVIRGGAWYYFSKLSRSAYRFRNHVQVKSYTIGFRVARDLD